MGRHWKARRRVSDSHHQVKMNYRLIIVIGLLALSLITMKDTIAPYKFINSSKVFINVQDGGRIMANEFEWQNKSCLAVPGTGLECV